MPADRFSVVGREYIGEGGFGDGANRVVVVAVVCPLLLLSVDIECGGESMVGGRRVRCWRDRSRSKLVKVSAQVDLRAGDGTSRC